MNIFNYIRSLVPALEKRHILNDLRMIREDLVDITLPSYVSGMAVLGEVNLRSKEAIEFEKAFAQAVTGHRVRGNFINVTHAALVLASEQVDVIEDAVKKHFAKDVISSGITYRQANILRYSELLRFVAKYARLRLILTMAAETNIVRGNSADMGKEVSNPEFSWLSRNRNSFMAAVAVIFESSRDLARVLNDVPDVTADPDNASVVANTVGLNKLDPKRLNRVGFNGNPFFHLRMLREDILTAEYEAALEEKRMMELLMMDFEQAQNGEEDAALQKKIESTRMRIENLKFRIEKRQRDAGEAGDE